MSNTFNAFRNPNWDGSVPDTLFESKLSSMSLDSHPHFRRKRACELSDFEIQGCHALMLHDPPDGNGCFKAKFVISMLEIFDASSRIFAKAAPYLYIML